MKMRINIVTVCSRVQNLITIKNSIFNELSSVFDVYWYITLDKSKVNSVPIELLGNDNILFSTIDSIDILNDGAGQARNILFNKIEEGYIHVIDDDNIVHPNFWNLIHLYGKGNNVIVGNQILNNGNIRLFGRRDNMFVSQVDSASITWDRKIQGDIMWNEVYCCDGIFVEELMASHEDKFVYTNETISYYNYLSI